MEELQLEHTSG